TKSGLLLLCFCAFLWLTPEARDHALVDLARHANVVEVVLADEIEFARLVEIKDLAAFHIRSLTRLDPERPSDVIETDVPLRAEPPAMHRVENTTHVVLTQVHERSRLDRVREAALKDERQIETDDVVSHELVTIGIEVLHHRQEILKRFLLVLFVTVLVDTKHVLAVFRTKPGKLQTRNRTNVQRDRQHTTRRSAQRTERVATFFFRRNVFEIPLLLLDAHVAKPHRALELRPDSFAKVGQRECFNIHRVRARELRLGLLVLAILLERDRTILRHDELRAILECFEFAGDAPETGFDPFLSFECLAPDFERDRAGGVACGGVAEKTALLRAALADRSDEHNQPEI